MNKYIKITLSISAVILLAVFVKYRIIEPRRPHLEASDIIKYFSFSKESCLKEWEEKILKGRVVYRLEKEGDDGAYVTAKSDNAASALYYRINLDIGKHPIIGWKWRVISFPEKSLPESIDNKKEEDFAARIYVIFPAAFFTGSKIIEYIWAEELEEGMSGTSGYSKNIKVMVLKKGPKPGWEYEQRDVYDDYVKLFGAKPSLNVGAIAFMTDSDSTSTEASCLYDDIKIGYKKGG